MKKIKVCNKKEFSFDGWKFNSFNLFYEHHLVKIAGNVYYNEPTSDDYMHSRGIVLAAAVALNFNGVKKYAVLHDSYFDNLPEYVKRFFIAHEVGHAANGDLEITESESIKNVIKRVIGILPKMEVEADRYAASIIGKDVVKKAIKFMVMKTNLPLNSKIELVKRYFLI